MSTAAPRRPPAVTADELEAAAAARSASAAVRRRTLEMLADGRLDWPRLLRLAEADAYVARIPVAKALAVTPGVRSAQQVMKAAGFAPAKRHPPRLGRLTKPKAARRREALLDEIAARQRARPGEFFPYFAAERTA